MDGLTSIIIPSRNEIFLQKTILDLLAKATQEIEIIAVLDGYWPPSEEIVDNPKVIYVHFSEAKGMRNAINSAVAIAKGEFLMKLDAHCMFAKGFDEVLKADCEDNWVVVPRRYALDPQKWEIIDNPKYPIDYMYLSKDLHGVVWNEKNKDPQLKEKLIDDVMSNQGSVWFMPKELFHKLDLMDEEHWGTFWNEFQEVGMKAWLGGYEVKVNKKTWYAHWHKTKSRGYSLPSQEQTKAIEQTEKWREFGKAWPKQKYPLSWLVKKFWPIPTWPDNRREELPKLREKLT